MRPLLILPALLVFATLAHAQDKVWTAAPVPTQGVVDFVMPAARSGERITDDGTTPFSGIPDGSVTSNGATSADPYNGVQTPDLSK